MIMNTTRRQYERDHLVRPDYYAQLWFEDDGQLTAAVLQDDYTAWYDLTAGIAGSNLADANQRTNKEELEILLEEWYLTAETAVLYYDVIETNDIEAATRAYPRFLERGFKYIPIQSKHMTSLASIRQRAQLLYIQETGDKDA
jgi:hypothetical protein